MTVALIVAAVLVLWFVVVRAWTRNDLRILTSDHKRYCSLSASHQARAFQRQTSSADRTGPMDEPRSEHQPPNPGSDKALAAGCICAVMDNCHGKFAPYPPDGWWITEGCPLHAWGDPEPQPGDGPEYHEDHAAWVRRQAAEFGRNDPPPRKDSA